MQLKAMFFKCNALKLTSPKIVYQTILNSFYSTSIDAYIQILLVEECSKKEMGLLKYFDSYSKNNGTSIACRPMKNTIMEIPSLEKWKNCRTGNVDLASKIELEMKGEKNIPNRKMYFILTYFVKSGDIYGVKTIQFILEKYNITHFKLYSEYKHYLAEALWIQGKIEDSLELFSVAYDNKLIRPLVIGKINSLFPLLISQHSEASLRKTVNSIEQFSADKDDNIILTYIWKELFQSEWFCNQQLANEIILRNLNILTFIHFIIPSMGKMLLNHHKVDTFYRLIQFTLQNDINQERTLIQLLFDYYYNQQNIERCSAVVKYSNDKSTSLLTESQERRYVCLLLRSKNASLSKLNIKKPKKLKYKF